MLLLFQQFVLKLRQKLRCCKKCLDVTTYLEHLQLQLEIPIRTSRKISRAKMMPDTAYTIADVKEMETWLRPDIEQQDDVELVVTR